MLEEKKDSQQRPADTGRPKMSRSNNAAQRFSLQTECCGPSPARGPLPSPLFGGLPGHPLLMGQQAASLQLAQLKAQLALTQINNALVAGGRVTCIPTTPPSPTAAAINLLNLLKIVNTMSHPLYNPYASRNQGSTQGQFGLSSDTQRASLCPGSSFSDGTQPLLMSQSLNYRPEQSGTIMEEGLERSIGKHRSRSRPEPPHSKRRDELPSSNTGITYPKSSTSAPLGQRLSDNASGSSSLVWSSNYKRPTADDSQFYSSSASSSYASSGNARFNAPTEREHDYPGHEKPMASQESSRPRHTSQSAANILLHYGLEREDLEQLASYPEDHITPANLPFVLSKICKQKGKRTASHPEPPPTRRVSGMGSESLGRSGGGGMSQDEIASAVLQPSKVIDYGHTGKYTGGAAGETGKTGGGRSSSGGSGSTFLMDSFDGNRHSRGPLPKSTPEVKSGVLDSSREQATTVTSLSSPYRSVQNARTPPSLDQTKRLQAQSNQTPQPAVSSLKDLKTERQLASKTQPPNTLVREVHPSRPGLVLIVSKGNMGAKSRCQGSAGSEQTSKQQSQQETEKQSTGQQMIQQKQTGEGMWPPVYSSVRPVLPVPPSPKISTSQALRPPLFIPGGLHPILAPPALLQPIQSLMGFMPLMTSSTQPPAKVPVQKSLPSPTMMCDYAAAPPVIFPQTCSLCKTECFHMKDWISHQNTSLHLENCRLLRKQYPEWDGETTLRLAGKDAKPSASTSQHRHQVSRPQSRSHSRSSSPRRHHGSIACSTPSGSAYSSRYTHRFQSCSRPPCYDHHTSVRYRTRSRSSGRRSLQREDKKNWSSTRRNDERQSSPGDQRQSLLRRTHERKSSQQRSDETQSSARRNQKRRSPPWRTDVRQLTLRRTNGRRSPQRSYVGRFPPRSNHERRSSVEAVQSLSEQSDLEAMVQNLAPDLLVAQMKTSSSSSSTPKTSKTSKAKPSQQKSEETDSKEQKKPPQKSKVDAREALEDDATYEILDSVEDEVVKEDRPATGRPQKEVKTSRKDMVGDGEALEKVAEEEEETTYQILDFEEDETIDDPTTGRAESSGKEEMSKNDTSVTRSAGKEDEEDEEEMFQIIDSLEDDQEEPTATFKPDNPLGQEFVFPKSGFFCNLCCVFYLNESAAKDLHCSSRRHYDNLQKHYQKLEQKPPRCFRGSVSD